MSARKKRKKTAATTNADGNNETNSSKFNYLEFDKHVDPRIVSLVNNRAFELARQTGTKQKFSFSTLLCCSIFVDEFIDENLKQSTSYANTLKKPFTPEGLYFAILRYLAVEENFEGLRKCMSDEAVDEIVPELINKIPDELLAFLHFLFAKDFHGNFEILLRYLKLAAEETKLKRSAGIGKASNSAKS